MTRALVLLSLVFTLSGCSSSYWPQPALGCHTLNTQYQATIDATKSATLDPEFLRVPVVIHFMSDHEDPANKRPHVFWTPALIETYFGVGNRSVNNVWKKAGIHFELVRVEVCHYTPPPGTFQLFASMAKGVFPPDVLTLRGKRPEQQQTIIDHYLQLNETYGIPRALNIYLWRALSDGITGYGESPRRNRVEVHERGLTALSTVWYESGFVCGSGSPNECQLRIAHEVGHALGLSHTCYLTSQSGTSCCTNLCWAPPDYYYACQGVAGETEWGNWCSCEGRPGVTAFPGLTVCGDPLESCAARHVALHRLMHPMAGDTLNGSGVELCEGEIHSARPGAKSFF